MGFPPSNHEQLENDWFCVRCFKTISPDRPPVLNLDNCSCSEAGTAVNDPHEHAALTQVHQTLPLSLALTMSNQQINGHAHAPPSYATSESSSIAAPSGPEARGPQNKYLPLAPEYGLGVDRHRKRASYDEIEDQLLDPQHSNLKTWTPLERSHDGPREICTSTEGFLKQNTHLMGPSESAMATRGAGSGGTSGMVSSDEYSTGSSGLEIDPVTGAGDWTGGSASVEWPMSIDRVDDEGD